MRKLVVAFVALTAAAALVVMGLGRGISQHLPPPAGIIGVPPVGAEPSVPPAGELAAPGDAGERHPNPATKGPRTGG